MYPLHPFSIRCQPPMNITLLSVPFNQDKHLNGMGQAPQALFEAGLLERLAASGVHVEYTEEAENNLGEGEMLTRLGRLQNIVCDDIYDSLKKNHPLFSWAAIVATRSVCGVD